MTSCPTCPDAARCDLLGLCQVKAKQQLPGPEPVLITRQCCTRCGGAGLLHGGFGDLDPCDDCGGSGRAKD